MTSPVELRGGSRAPEPRRRSARASLTIPRCRRDILSAGRSASARYATPLTLSSAVSTDATICSAAGDLLGPRTDVLRRVAGIAERGSALVDDVGTLSASAPPALTTPTAISSASTGARLSTRSTPAASRSSGQRRTRLRSNRSPGPTAPAHAIGAVKGKRRLRCRWGRRLRGLSPGSGRGHEPRFQDRTGRRRTSAKATELPLPRCRVRFPRSRISLGAPPRRHRGR